MAHFSAWGGRRFGVGLLLLSALQLLYSQSAAERALAPLSVSVYCTPGNFSGCGTAPITRVQLTGTTLDNASTCQNNGFGNAYVEYPATGATTATVQQNVVYRFGLTSSSSNASLAAWVDWNQDNNFSASEFYYLVNGGSAGVTYWMGMDVPANAVLGQTTMRVRSRSNASSINSSDACANYTSGETEDYTLTVTAAPVPAPAYCIPSNFVAGCGSASITQVQITGTTLNNTSTCQLNQFGNAYSVFQPTGSATGTVQQGVTYRLGLTSSSSNASLAAWVDWNQDNNFSASEFYYLVNGGSAGVTYWMGMEVPSDAVLGQTTMRVRSRSNAGSLIVASACDHLTSGEAEDYTITVAAAPPPTSPYCMPSNFVAGCGSASITQVQLTGTTLNNTSTCQLNTYGNAYSVFQPAGSATATVQRSVTYRFGLTSSSSNATLAAWIDWDQDGAFEGSEFISVVTGGSAGAASWVGLEVPATATLGQTTMRVRSRSNSSSIFGTDACSVFSSGETEDYTITVAAAPSPPTYCVPSNFIAGCGSASITQVQLTGTTLNNTSSCQLNANGNAYAIFQPTGSATGTVQQSVTYRFGLTSSSSNATLAAWIDWDQDGAFEGSEFISVVTGGSAGVASWVGLEVPATAALGQTTMRVRSRSNSSSIFGTDPCSVFGSGETEDYTITVAAAPNPAPLYCTPSNFIAGCGSASITRVQLTGSGLNNASSCQLDTYGNAYAQVAPTGTATGTLQPGTTYSIGVTSSSNNATLAAWADWDHDGLFEGSEFVLVSSGASANVAVFVGLPVPAGAALGQTTLRVRSRSNGSSIFGTDACSVFASGETEDYLLTVGSCSLATPTISASGGACSGSTLTLTATGVPAGAAYLWTGPNSFSSALASPQIPNLQAANAGTYSLSISSGGCSATSAGLVVTVSPLPTVAISANGSLALCQGESVTLTATGASTYLWTTGASTPSITVSAAGQYGVTGTSTAGCQGTAPAVTVSVTTRPTAGISANGSTTFCQGGSVTLTATGGSAGATYRWLRDGTPIVGATGSTHTASISGSYAVEITLNGCSGTSAATVVTVNPMPSAAFAYGSGTYCRTATNPAPSITGASGGTFSATPAGLSLNATTGALNLSASAVGTYTITYSISGTCPATASQTVTITSSPLATFSYPGGTRCAGSAGTVAPTLGPGASGVPSPPHPLA